MDTSLFTKDITDLFDRKRGGHVEQWLYAGKEGSDYWRSFVRAGKGKYYIPYGDIRLIEYAVKALSEKLKDVKALVDFGVDGSSALRSKIFPIIDGCSNIAL